MEAKPSNTASLCQLASGPKGGHWHQLTSTGVARRVASRLESHQGLGTMTAIQQQLGPILGHNFLCPKEQLAPPQSQQVSAPESLCSL